MEYSVIILIRMSPSMIDECKGSGFIFYMFVSVQYNTFYHIKQVGQQATLTDISFKS